MSQKYGKCFTCISSCDPHKPIKQVLLVFAIYLWQHGGLNDVPKITLLVSREARMTTQVFLTPVNASAISHSSSARQVSVVLFLVEFYQGLLGKRV